MLFNSLEFIFIFLPIVLALYWAARGVNVAGGTFVLLAASLAFYAWWNVWNLPILIASMAFNFAAGICVLRAGRNRRSIMIAAVAINLLALAYYKYTGFIIENFDFLTGSYVTVTAPELPIGISFFTFTQIAFLVDAYQRKASEPNLANYGLFVTYFPHLIAGPILHHKEMMPQFTDCARKSISEGIAVGLAIFTIGLFKKVVIADQIATYASPVFEAFDGGQVLSAAAAWVGALAYTFQIYFDFSAYCDMAVGISFMFGVRLPVNFYSPYKATSIIDFWRLWHMTLSRFLRDYLYIPLGGNRHGSVRRYANLAITMLLGGLWHGASWNFVLWGALHGIYLGINHAFRAFSPVLHGWFVASCGWALTFLAVVVAWVFFRATTFGGAVAMLTSMAGLADGAVDPTINIQRASIAMLLCTLIVVALPNTYQIFARYQPALLPKGLDVPESQIRWSPTVKVGLVTGVVFTASIVLMSQGFAPSEFLYFQF